LTDGDRIILDGLWHRHHRLLDAAAYAEDGRHEELEQIRRQEEVLVSRLLIRKSMIGSCLATSI
jgi:hypothetical protein